MDKLKRLDCENKTTIKKSLEKEIKKTIDETPAEPIIFLKNVH